MNKSIFNLSLEDKKKELSKSTVLKTAWIPADFKAMHQMTEEEINDLINEILESPNNNLKTQ